MRSQRKLAPSATCEFVRRAANDGICKILLIYAVYVTVLRPLLSDVSELRAPPDLPEFMFASA